MNHNDRQRTTGTESPQQVEEWYRYPVGTWEEERQRFTNSRAAEGVEYHSSEEAYQDFKAYYDKRLKVASEAGISAWSGVDETGGGYRMT